MVLGGSAIPRNRPFEALVLRLQHAQTRAAVGGAVTATPTIPTIASTDSVIDAFALTEQRRYCGVRSSRGAFKAEWCGRIGIRGRGRAQYR